MPGPSPADTPSPGETVALGLLQGPAELLPISSSAHVALVPWLLGWEHAELPGEVRKEVEVALHAGTALALLATGEGRARRWLGLVALVPPAIAALALERTIENRLGGPGSVAVGLAAGGVAMALADRNGPGHRRPADATLGDAVVLGVAQAAALIPGVSRSGMTRAAARGRGFDRASAAALSREVALPVLAGAAVLKGVRVAQRRPGPRTLASLAAGTAAATLSTTLAARAERRLTGRVPYAAWAVYRVGVAAGILAVRQNRCRT
jgi:undecaprenyl-diphosphatase